MSDPHPEHRHGLAEDTAATKGGSLSALGGEALPHVREAEDLQAALIRQMPPGRRLEIAQDLYETAWNIKKAGLRAQHPDWSQEQIAAKLRRVFVTGYAGA